MAEFTNVILIMGLVLLFLGSILGFVGGMILLAEENALGLLGMVPAALIMAFSLGYHVHP